MNTTTIEECKCWFRQSKGKHIFNIRTECKLELYSSEFIPQRWTRQHYMYFYTLFRSFGTIDTISLW